MAQNNPICVGITGGIGAGKSVVCKVFNTLSIPSYDADSRAKSLVNRKDIRDKIVKLLGSKAYENGIYQKEFVAKEVFSDQKKLTELNAIIHPAVARDFEDWASDQKAPYVVKEAALLFESDSYKSLDAIITVTAPDTIRVQRVLKRDIHRTEEDVQNIMNKQWPQNQKVEMSQFEIKNDEQTLVTTQVLSIHNKLIEQVSR